MNATVEEYKKWLNGEANSEYNNVRFAKDKFEAGKKWLKERKPDLDMENPKTLPDFIAKYKYEDMNPLKVTWADKIGVYSALYDLDMEDLHIPMLAPLYKLFYKPCDAEIDQVIDIALKQPSIIKCNHGSGWNIKVIPGQPFNREFVKEKLKTWLGTNYAYISGYEWHYEPIVPGLLVQPLLAEQPLDWQFYCLDGQIVALDLQKKIGKSFVENLAWVDEHGKAMDWYIGFKPTMESLPASYVAIMDKMKPYVLGIAKKFKFVRVDLFHIDNKVKFCEATFAPCSGILDLSKRE